MAYVHFDSSYAPCAFLIVKDGGDPYKEADTILCQLDYDYPHIALRMGWTPKGDLEGPHNIALAWDHIRIHAGRTFTDLDEYFEEN